MNNKFEAIKRTDVRIGVPALGQDSAMEVGMEGGFIDTSGFVIQRSEEEDWSLNRGLLPKVGRIGVEARL